MKKVLCILLALTLVMLTFASCGGKRNNKTDDPDVQGSDVSFDGDSTVASSFPSKLIARKTAEVYADRAELTKGGVIYTASSGKLGFGPFDGRYDSGAKFVQVQACENYFCTLKNDLKGKDPSDLNVFALYDAYGNMIAKDYAYYNVMNQYYVQAWTATERTYKDSDNINLAKKDNKIFSTVVSDVDAVYAGTFVVLDLETGKKVPNVDFASMKNAYANGRVLTCYNDDQRYVVFPDGSSVPGSVKSFNDGCFRNEETTSATVYDPDGNEIFSYNPNDFSITNSIGDYFLAIKYTDGTASYFLVDHNGEKVSAEFEKSPELYGSLVKADDKLCDLKGNKIASLDGAYVTYDTLSKACWSIREGDNYKYIYENGNEMLSVTKKDKDIEAFSTYFTAGKKTNDNSKLYFSLKDNDYTIKGNPVASFVMQVTDGDGRYDAVDAISGETLFEGYKHFSYAVNTDNGNYILAPRTEGNYDIYLIQNEFDAAKNNLSDSYISDEDLKRLYAKQQDLFSALETAFADAGITANINRETGEIGIDSNVIFGGDSAKLSDDGKKVLNKFLSAYDSIISDDMFSGFIKNTIIEGNTAPVDGVSYEDGLPLSEERAENVLKYFNSADTDVEIDKDDFKAIGNSNANPVYNLDGTVNMDESRRVTFRFIINEDYRG